ARARTGRGRASGAHGDDPGARRDGHRRVARRAAGEDGVLERLQGARRVVEPDSSLLNGRTRTRLRAAAFVLLLGGVVTWDAIAPHLDPVGLWQTVAIIAAGVLPATLGLIYLALPLWSNRRAIAVGPVGFLPVGIVTWPADAHLASNFAKLATYT